MPWTGRSQRQRSPIRVGPRGLSPSGRTRVCLGEYPTFFSIDMPFGLCCCSLFSPPFAHFLTHTFSPPCVCYIAGPLPKRTLLHREKSRPESKHTNSDLSKDLRGHVGHTVKIIPSFRPKTIFPHAGVGAHPPPAAVVRTLSLSDSAGLPHRG